MKCTVLLLNRSLIHILDCTSYEASITLTIKVLFYMVNTVSITRV